MQIQAKESQKKPRTGSTNPQERARNDSMTSDREWSGEYSDIPITSLQNSEKTCACSSKLFDVIFSYGSLEKLFRTGVAEVRALAALSETWIHFTVPTWKLLSVSNLTLSHKHACIHMK